MRMLKKKNNIEFDIASFRKQVALDVKDEPGNSLQSLEKFLTKWWCRHYNRPYKNIGIMDYTLEELLYEYFDIQLRQDPKQLEEALGGGDQPNEDEEWLKDMMGAQYMSQDGQEKELGKHKDEIDSLSNNKGQDGFDHTFNLDEFE